MRPRTSASIETGLTFAFHHLQEYFNGDPYGDRQRTVKEACTRSAAHRQAQAETPVFIDSNHFGPLVPWTSANQLGRDWCAGRRRQFWTNDQPPFLSKLSVNHALAYFMDGERGILMDRRPVKRRPDHAPAAGDSGRFDLRTTSITVPPRRQVSCGPPIRDKSLTAGHGADEASSKPIGLKLGWWMFFCGAQAIQVS